ncbi:SDR family NAD(P)-dependent oxidoreductase [Sinomicrobium weinanense]|uniref:SDR family oxidoreductase n=1 Tax=Sinomicrobium weinanense TaxID=2842200 RepID=A0A926Q4C9_9FLAO|nr:SDR family oxidoreductase [Sinomicrobium weinanense]MBC9797829.1 SDR family oxidoreductase [Sinomicrobium weinanense]MBU3124664.1 SDR family oxidoreductase [Sinomicrobium weinanense]
MNLQNKNAVIYGAGPSLGGAVSKAFANAGARVFVTNHKLETARKIADEINRAGENAEAAEVDAMNEDAVNRHLDDMIRTAGTVDISFNAINLQDTQNIPLINMSLTDFERPVNIATKAHFLTAIAASQRMTTQKSGIILSLTATSGGIGYPNVGGFGPACAFIECFSRNLACELGPHNVRVVNIRSAGSPDSRPFREAAEKNPEAMEGMLNKLKDDTMLKQLPVMEDICNTAVFLASEKAGKITGVTIDLTVGTTTALNYKPTNIAF